MAEAPTTEAIRQGILDESGGRCCMCLAHIGFQVEVVPIVPLTESGTFSAGNLATLCAFCRWLLQRQKVSPTAIKAAKKLWAGQVHKAPRVYHEQGLGIQGHPLRLEATHGGVLTVLEGSELTALLTNFFNCLDTFLIHEDQHLENAASLAVIRAFRDMYSYVPPEQDIKEQSTADSRKLDLLYRGIRALFSVGLASKSKPSSKPSGAKSESAGGKSKPASRPVAKKKPAKAAPKPAAKPAKTTKPVAKAKKAAAKPKPSGGKKAKKR